MLPDKDHALISWVPNENGEIVIKSAIPLHFYGPDPESDESASRGKAIFDYSRMKGRYYAPDEKICLIFDCVDYKDLRKKPEFARRH